jgi:ribonucleoside-diphosphate reductase beta chain
MGIGYFSAAEGIVGDNLLHVIREKVTAPELRLVLGRHAHEENIHADSLLYMISSLGIDPHECEAMFEQIPTIRKKNEFVNRVSRSLRRDMDMSVQENQRLFAKNAFLFGQCLEGTQFFGLFAMILGLGANCKKFTGIAEMFDYTLRDESNHIDLLRHLFLEIVKENPSIWDETFQEELCGLMREAVALEKDFIRDCLPMDMVGMNASSLASYIDYIADCRLAGVGLPTSGRDLVNPFPWLDGAIFINREKNFFERRVTSYQQADVTERRLSWLESGMSFEQAS